jgi:hypothetical protein
MSQVENSQNKDNNGLKMNDGIKAIPFPVEFVGF